MRRAGAEAAWPFEKGVRWFWRGAALRARLLWRSQQAATRVRALEDEVEQLRLEVRMLEDVAAENRELRASLGLPPSAMRRPLKCQAVSWGGALGWWQSVKIDRGARDGVREGDAVVCADGLVGRVKTVFPDFSDVRLITDANSRISCALALPEDAPAVRGILKGAGWAAAGRAAENADSEAAPSEIGAENASIDAAPSEIGALPFLFVAQPMRLEYLGRRALDAGLLAARTKVVTSGLSGSIPGGIPVGWLVGAELDADGLYGVGEVLPAVDFASLRTMAVLAGGGGGAP